MQGWTYLRAGGGIAVLALAAGALPLTKIAAQDLELRDQQNKVITGRLVNTDGYRIVLPTATAAEGEPLPPGVYTLAKDAPPLRGSRSPTLLRGTKFFIGLSGRIERMITAQRRENTTP